MPIQFKEDLDIVAARGCIVPDCPYTHGDDVPIYIAQNCHPGGLLEVSYCQGRITIDCQQCMRNVAVIEVANRPTLRRL